MSSRVGPAACLLIAWVFGLSIYANSSHWIDSPEELRWLPPFQAGVDLNHNGQLGAEYFRIATALVDGRGFSDPFGVATGPTAWMPPLYPSLLAGLLWLLGDEVRVAWAIVLFKNCTLVLAGLVVFDLARRSRVLLNPAWTLLAYGIWLLAYFSFFFQFTHDIWFTLALITANLALAHRIRFEAARRFLGLPWQWVWGALGGASLLASPVAGLAWGAVSGQLALRDRGLRKAAIAALLLAVLLASGWVVRNALVFDRLILMKSNLYYDLYLANYVSPNGVYDRDIFVEHHPMWQNKRGGDFLYGKLGETAFLDLHRTRFLANLRRGPGTYLRKVWNRLLAVTLWYPPYRPEIEGRHPLFQTLVQPLPFLGLLALILLGGAPGRALAALAGTLYAAYLTPYVVVAFYNRYFLPLTPVLLLLVYWGADAAVGFRRSRGDSERSAAAD